MAAAWAILSTNLELERHLASDRKCPSISQIRRHLSAHLCPMAYRGQKSPDHPCLSTLANSRPTNLALEPVNPLHVQHQFSVQVACSRPVVKAASVLGQRLKRRRSISVAPRCLTTRTTLCLRTRVDECPTTFCQHQHAASHWVSADCSRHHKVALVHLLQAGLLLLCLSANLLVLVNSNGVVSQMLVI